jgi:hypothetical protein
MLKEKIVLLKQINYDKKMNSHITERRITMLPTTIDGCISRDEQLTKAAKI